MLTLSLRPFATECEQMGELQHIVYYEREIPVAGFYAWRHSQVCTAQVSTD